MLRVRTRFGRQNSKGQDLLRAIYAIQNTDTAKSEVGEEEMRSCKQAELGTCYVLSVVDWEIASRILELMISSLAIISQEHSS